MAKRKLKYEQDMGTETGPTLGGNWVAVRRGLLEHIQYRDLSNQEALCFIIILLLADAKTGCWWGNAPELSRMAGGVGCNELAAQKVLRSLGKKGYVRSLREAGSRGRFPIVVNKYRVTCGNSSGMLVCAAKTTHWRRPEFYPVGEGVTDGVGDGVSEGVTPYSIPNTEYGRNETSVSASATLSHPSDANTTGDTPVPPHTGIPRDPTGEVSPVPSPIEPADQLLSAWGSVAPKRSISRPEARQWLEQGHPVQQETNIIRWLFTTSHIAEESQNYKGEFAIRSFFDYCKHHPRIQGQWARYMEKKEAGEVRAAEQIAALEVGMKLRHEREAEAADKSKKQAQQDPAGDAHTSWVFCSNFPGDEEDFADILATGVCYEHLDDVIRDFLRGRLDIGVPVSNSADFKQHFPELSAKYNKDLSSVGFGVPSEDDDTDDL